MRRPSSLTPVGHSWAVQRILRSLYSLRIIWTTEREWRGWETEWNAVEPERILSYGRYQQRNSEPRDDHTVTISAPLPPFIPLRYPLRFLFTPEGRRHGGVRSGRIWWWLREEWPSLPLLTPPHPSFHSGSEGDEGTKEPEWGVSDKGTGEVTVRREPVPSLLLTSLHSLRSCHSVRKDRDEQRVTRGRVLCLTVSYSHSWVGFGWVKETVRPAPHHPSLVSPHEWTRWASEVVADINSKRDGLWGWVVGWGWN